MFGLGLPELIIIAVVWLYPSLCIWKIAGKTGIDAAWMAWIPVLSLYVICKIGRKSGWWFFPCLVPYVGAIVILWLMYQIPVALGVKGPARILAIVPIINFLYIGYLAFRTETTAVVLRQYPDL